jgi:hypothetical protein
MTTTISPIVLSILPTVEQMTISDAQFAAFNWSIDRKLSERVWTAKDADSQTILDKISEAYKKGIEYHKENLKSQYDLGKKMIEQIKSVQDVALIQTILQEFQTAMQPLLETHKQIETAITALEGRIIPLLPANTQFVNPPPKKATNST